MLELTVTRLVDGPDNITWHNEFSIRLMDIFSSMTFVERPHTLVPISLYYNLSCLYLEFADNNLYKNELIKDIDLISSTFIDFNFSLNSSFFFVLRIY